MRREKKKRNKIIIGLISILFLMTVGYAAFQTNLNIKGTSKISSNWDIRITNVTIGTSTGNGENAKTPTWTNLTASMEANLYEKGDAMEYQVTVENKGTFDAKLENILTNIKSNNEAIKISFSGYTKGEKLYKNTSKVVNVKIEYNKDFEGTPPSTSSEVEITLDYGQAEGGTIKPTNDYLVTYDCKTNGGEDCSKYNEYLSEGSKIDLSYTATKAGWTFAGWNTNKDATIGLSSLEMKNADVTLYAIYKKTINVSYSKGTGISAIGKTTDSCVMYNNATSCQITLPSITASSGYGVDGWYSPSNTKVGTEGTKVNVSSNITYTAKGKANSYTLTYNYNGATSGNSTTSKAVTYNSTYGTLPSPTRSYVVTYNYNGASGGNSAANATSNYMFNGWYKENTFTNQVTSTTIYNIAANSTIYAKWTSTSVTLPSPSKTGYTFGGWYSDSSLTNKVGEAGASYTPTSNQTLYAKWTDTTKPTVSLNPNTGATYVSGGKAVTVTLADAGSGLKASQPIYYAWSTSNTTVPTTWSSVTSTNTAGAKSATVTVPAASSSSLTGTYYLWIKAGTLSDVSGNTSNQVVSALFKFDNTTPEVSVSASKTTNSITAVATASATSGITKYEFSKDNGSTWIDNGTSNTYTFTGLKHNSIYSIKVMVTSGVGLNNTGSIDTGTNKIDAPTYEISPSGEMWSQSKTLTVTAACTDCTNTYSIDNGETWIEFPSNPFKLKYQVSGKILGKSSDGTNTVSSSFVITNIDSTPPGIIKINASSSTPDGYLPCDGREISRTTYSNLFSKIGTTYGQGNGSTTFNVPNLNGKVPVGKDSSNFSSLGDIGGSINNTLTTANLPVHTHTVTSKGTVSSVFTGQSVSTSSNGAHTHGLGYDWRTLPGTAVRATAGINTAGAVATNMIDSAGAHTHTVTPKGSVTSTFNGSSSTTSTVGSGEPFSNLKPYIIENYVIKY
ncbi:MAG: InlB B-repeat-containing protein [Bacilli bacterium]